MEQQCNQTCDEDRRAFLGKFSKAAVITPPVITMMLSTSMTSKAIARSTGAKVKGNNGVGNGYDPQPPGNPPMNDGAGSGPGSPGMQGGNGHASGASLTHGNGKGNDVSLARGGNLRR